jgi:hypothetical protein
MAGAGEKRDEKKKKGKEGQREGGKKKGTGGRVPFGRVRGTFTLGNARRDELRSFSKRKETKRAPWGKKKRKKKKKKVCHPFSFP